MVIAVYCSSSDSIRKSYKQAASRLGEAMAEQDIDLVYGDGGIGLMAAVADGVLSKGGNVIGVIPRFMVDEGWNNPKSTRTIITKTMHERKATIARLADAIVALPGGIGTAEELLECLTWKQLGLHSKPIVILNTCGYYDTLLHFLDIMVEEKMMRPMHREKMFSVVNSPDDVFAAIQSAPEWDSTNRTLAKV